MNLPNNKWEKVKSKGLIRFIAGHGLVWACIVFSILKTIEYIQSDHLSISEIEIFVWLSAGIVYGLILWFYYNRIYSIKD